MAKTLSALIDYAEQAVQGPLDSRLDVVEVVNDAGTAVVAMCPWPWLERPPVSLNFTQNQAYVPLPLDTGEVISLEVSDSLATTVELTSLEEVMYLRGSSLNSPFHFYCALSYPEQRDSQKNAPEPRLELYPTPGTSESGKIVMRYRAGWVRLRDMDNVSNVPVNIEILLVEMVRAFAIVMHSGGLVSEAVTKIAQSYLYQSLKSRYGMSQGSLGLHGGGILAGSSSAIYRPFANITR